MEPKWLTYAKKLQAIAQAGLTYSKDPYDIERFEEIRNISVEIMNDYTGIGQEQIKEWFTNETGYPTPKIDVRGAIIKEEKILLVKEKADGKWALPGGWADMDCSLNENLIKEAIEEAGAQIKPKRIIAIWDRRNHNEPPMPYGCYKIFVECDFIAGEFERNTETSDARFFSIEELPPLSEGRNTKEQIQLCFDVSRKETHEALFD
ncbi:ADP-ribose pyrophosphatase YjhB (NUDIX family) [Bacillus pakistanensis]|uniref:ADP-ribose pyrophosphatase YjhB (NUDIX family) n=1 Tax=Rossellomorea pakistanensis TaxID=992288 RepID=A0ABS2NIZ0_9BACI|nr:NUDIX hydrolase [Bacillus pakistanensis]MBM7587804.1 ADP-ribose pyrophosphatase YjhB (NUDIX family) [Bacillus pakistanensis]